MTIGDREYYRRRAEQESVAAEDATTASAREVHLDLAERYSAKLQLIDALSARSTMEEPRLEPAPVRRGARR